MAYRTKKLTPKLAQALCCIVDELGADFASKEDATVYEQAGAALGVSPTTAMECLVKLEGLGLITLVRQSAWTKTHRFIANTGAYQTALKLLSSNETAPVSEAAKRMDRELHAIPASAGSRLRLQGLRGDRCR